jgi:hypothetical protein
MNIEKRAIQYQPSPDRPSTNTAPSGQPLVAHFDERDPADPHHWPAWKRYGVVVFASWLNVLVCIGASGYSTGADSVVESFGVSAEVATVGLSLYIVRACVTHCECS